MFSDKHIRRKISDFVKQKNQSKHYHRILKKGVHLKTKTILTLFLVFLLCLLFTGCGKSSGNNSQNNTGSDGLKNLTLSEIVEKLYANVDVPPYETVSLDETNFEYFAFVPYADGLSAVAADALVNITPHSMVVIYDKNGNGSEIAQKVAENADLNKWLCVGSETGNVLYTGHYVVLIMSDKETVDAITENFKTMSNDLDGISPGLLSLTNSRYEQ